MQKHSGGRAAATRERGRTSSGQRAFDESAHLDALATLAANRIAIEAVSPEIDAGRFPAKTVVNAPFTVEADVFSDGHDAIRAALLWRPAGERDWREQPMMPAGEDRWRAVLRFPENRAYEYTITAWRDLFTSWRLDTAKKYEARQPVALEIEEGRRLIETSIASSATATAEHMARLKSILEALKALDSDTDRYRLLVGEDVGRLMAEAGIRADPGTYEHVLGVFVDRPAAAFSAWYELAPRSQGPSPDRHGTLRDVIRRLPYVRDLGFDVLYLMPIHPIGLTNRKGPDNSPRAAEGDPGSPYAIGSEAGGHDAIHPELGTLADFDELVSVARALGLEIALDFAVQCSPDHPWIARHPEWFDWRPDGTLKFAENPPKKYEDIVNVHFYRKAIPGLWEALRDIVLFWVGHGVTIFRVDNPHTKPLPFWEWMIGEVHARHPEVIFLAEAFTRPKLMKRLAKIGFTQSYSYFTWRNAKWELEQYLTELTQEDCRHYMRPNFFANTPDINPFYLQTAGRPGFQARLVLAATLASNYGIYNGFEICEADALPGREEYANSEKYQIRHWDFDRPDNIKWDIRFINRLRREHEALHEFANLAFYNAWNDNILYYGKRTADLADFLLFHVCLDPHHAQETHFEVPLWEFGLPDDGALAVEDMITGNRFTWHGKRQFVRLDPFYRPYAIWRIIGPGARR